MHEEPITIGGIGLGPFHMATNAAIPIDETRVRTLTDAMNGVRMVLGFEDRYAMMIDNLMDLERHLFDWALIDMLRPQAGTADLFTHKRDANRYLGNLLSACRQYIDQTHRLVGPTLAEAGVDSQAVLRSYYDTELSYRVMEALRNYMQHNDQGVHNATIGGSWIEGRKARRYVVSIGLDLEHLDNERVFKASIIDELKELGAIPDLKRMMREYISFLGSAHKQFRAALKPQVDAWFPDVDHAFADVQTAFPDEKLNVLATFRQREDDRVLIDDVFKEPLERLVALQRFNMTTLNLGPAYASSEAMS